MFWRPRFQKVYEKPSGWIAGWVSPRFLAARPSSFAEDFGGPHAAVRRSTHPTTSAVVEADFGGPHAAVRRSTHPTTSAVVEADFGGPHAAVRRSTHPTTRFVHPFSTPRSCQHPARFARARSAILESLGSVTAKTGQVMPGFPPPIQDPLPPQSRNHSSRAGGTPVIGPAWADLKAARRSGSWEVRRQLERLARGPRLVNSTDSLGPSTRTGTSPKRQRVDSGRDHPFTRWRFGLVGDSRGHFPSWAYEPKDHLFTRWRFGLVGDSRGHVPSWAHEPSASGLRWVRADRPDRGTGGESQSRKMHASQHPQGMIQHKLPWKCSLW